MSGLPSEPLRVLIVDDEPLARLRLRRLLEAPEGPPVTVVGEADDAITALAALAELGAQGPEACCDLVLLDIALPGRDGLQLAAGLRQGARPPAVVFVTAHAEHALQAFDLEAVDYLTKPVRRDRLAIALARVMQRRAAAAGQSPPDAQPALVLHERGRVLRLPLVEILYLKAGQKYVSVVSRAGQWLTDESLAELEPRLGAGFLRIHRNALVARAAARALARRSPAADNAGSRALASAAEPAADEGWYLQVANGDWLAVSRRQLAALREALAGASR